MNNIQITPAILATSEKEYRDEVERIENSGLFVGGWVQIDFADNKFVQNKSVAPEVVAKYPINMKREAHLMVRHPIEWIMDLTQQKFERIIFHVESDDVRSNLDYIEDQSIESGLAIKLDTPLDALNPYLKDIDVLLIMSIDPGFQGRQFEYQALERIKKVAKIRRENKLNFKIEVDGGITVENAKLIVEAGANCLIIGSHLINGNIFENFKYIQESLRNSQS